MTLTDLKSAVLRELRVLASGEPADADDVVLVGDKYAALYDMLLTKGLVAWTASADLPDYADIPVTWMLAYYCAPSFGVNQQRMMELRTLGALDLSPALGGPSEAERMLRIQLAKGYVSYPAQSDYF